MIRLKRVYEPVDTSDGQRLLVERLWPRGISKERAAIDAWLKEIAPSPELRLWYGHDPARWEAFRERYRAELDGNPQGVQQLEERLREGPVTFVYAARDEAHNSARILKEYLEGRRR